MNKSSKWIGVLLFNILALAAIAYLFEFGLWFISPERKLPENDYRTVTWGHKVRNNRFGFRERDFSEQKPAGLVRIMVLGDSLTWGAGLDVSERYTNLLEKYLNQSAGSARYEVLNFGTSAEPTAGERNIFLKHASLVKPDLVIVGFCLNDPQPKEQSWSVERQAFKAKYGPRLFALRARLNKVHLWRIGALIESSAYRFAELTGRIPTWKVALDRTYQPASHEYMDFEKALKDIRKRSDELGLPAPVFITLNQGLYNDRPTDYLHPNDDLLQFLKWYHQAERSAADAGFIVVNVELEIGRELNDHVLSVNPADGHPSRELNVLYARKLLSVISGMKLSAGLTAVK